MTWQLFTVPKAIYLLFKGGYNTTGNIVVTLLSLPVVLVLAFFLTAVFGHFHI